MSGELQTFPASGEGHSVATVILQVAGEEPADVYLIYIGSSSCRACDDPEVMVDG